MSLGLLLDRVGWNWEWCVSLGDHDREGVGHI